MSAHSPLVAPDILRQRFSAALSHMYRQEVPDYGTLCTLVRSVNEATLAQTPELAAGLSRGDALERLSEERHGAIRLGSAAELAVIARLFAVLGMSPVGYYDLSSAGLPVHSTAFRPIGEDSLRLNAFRVFTSVLRLDLIDDAGLRREAAALLATRQIVAPGLQGLIEQAERDGGLNENSAGQFLAQALEVFRWQPRARARAAVYQRLLARSGLLADVAAFSVPHLNHLTPRTLDIDAVQAQMPMAGLTAKDSIEGPPLRRCPILLRQTAFRALREPVDFPDGAGGWVTGSHTARFGEVEQRGAALTPKGQTLYAHLLAQAARAQASSDSRDLRQREAIRRSCFADFPDDWATLHRQQLAHFEYRLTPAGQRATRQRLERGPAQIADGVASLIDAGLVEYTPITYEDFLPVSAAGIFRSNLGPGATPEVQARPDRAAFEAALEAPLIDDSALYAAIEYTSARAILDVFGSPSKDLGASPRDHHRGH